MVVLTAMLIDSQVMLRDECDLRARLDSRGMAPPFAPTCAPRDCCQNAAYRAHLRRAAQPPCAWPALSARRHHHQPCAARRVFFFTLPLFWRSGRAAVGMRW
jgi:hypothetical protein